MIQFNLLPDIKLQYIKAQRTKRTVILLSTIVAGSALAIFVLMFLVVNVAQREHLGNLQKDIDTGKKELQSKQNLSEILTIQNQLNSLPGLHSKKPVATRVYSYIQQVTPQNVSISSLKVNFTEQTMEITGSADSLAAVNTYVDTLKFTTFKAQAADPDSGDSDTATNNAFSEVVLSNFGLSSGQNAAQGSKPASYTITLKYDAIIFDDSKTATLITNPQVTTRSETEKPNDIFQTQTTNGAGQ